MPAWPAKDPDAVKDYTYTIALDEGDAVATASLAKLSGDVVIDNDPDTERVGPLFTVWLSGGTEGETNVFRVEWETTAGRIDDDIITIATIARESDLPLPLTGYAKPAVAHLIQKYPSFADVERTTIQFWLTDAERYVDESWMEGDYAAALMAMAAHNLSLSGLGTEAAATADLPAGITGMRIGTLGLNFDSGITKAKAEGTLSATRYGVEYATLLRRNKAGPRVMGTGAVPGWYGRYPMGEW